MHIAEHLRQGSRVIYHSAYGPSIEWKNKELSVMPHIVSIVVFLLLSKPESAIGARANSRICSCTVM
jgi:hypothetical protein